MENLSSNMQNNNILDFLYELKKKEEDFVPSLLNLLSKYFNFNDSGFANCYYNDYFIEDPVEKESNNLQGFSSLFQTAYKQAHIIDQQNLKLLKPFLCFYSKGDFLCRENLPSQYKRKKVVISSEFPDNYYQKTPRYKFYSDLGYHYFANVYLEANNHTLGRIGILRTKIEGDFTPEDILILETIQKHISFDYKFNIEYNFISKKYDMLYNCNDNAPIGVVCLRSDFSVVEANIHAQKYCEEIMDEDNFTNPDWGNSYTSSNQNSSIDVVTRYIASRVSIINNNAGYVFRTLNAMYTCSIVNSIAPDIWNNNIETHYFLYISKQTDKAQQPLENLAQQYNLTSSEMKVVYLIKKGYRNSDIAKTLLISESTVKSHISNIFRKLNVKNRVSILQKLEDPNFQFHHPTK